MSIQQKTNVFIEEQIVAWPLLRSNHETLNDALIRTFSFDEITIRIQFNPKRITSSAARVDKVSIEKRPCFLCSVNWPPEEGFLAFGEYYEILCNPFPIFRKHLTISHVEHTPQVIDSEFSSMLDLSLALPEMVVFYNAPACGASAPDHMHFQAGNRGFMPIEEELNSLLNKHGQVLVKRDGFTASSVDDGLRRFMVLESRQKEPIEDAFSLISGFMRRMAEGEEPMLNILSYYNKGWQILVFLREKHRPWQYFDEGDENILLSPAAVDMGGTLIAPLEKDFLKIDRGDIEDIFHQIVLTERKFEALIQFFEKQF
jgi:hypothetical protein